MIPVVLSTEFYSPELCAEHPNTLFVFGDNIVRSGKGGQAIIRDCPNSLGIATKVLPSNKEKSFFSDDNESNLEIMLNDIRKLHSYIYSPHNEYRQIVLPYHGLGTGLSRMPEKAPYLFSILTKLVYEDNYLSSNQFYSI